MVASLPSLPATAIAVVVQRSTKNPQQLQIAVSAQIPRKRTSTDDRICYNLQYWLFWDDKRNVSLLDALLTRLAPLSAVHLACTERAEVSWLYVCCFHSMRGYAIFYSTASSLLPFWGCFHFQLAAQKGWIISRRKEG